jgi:hypothetical protein
MSPWVIIVLLSLATHRITRVITRDWFPPIRKVRVWIDHKLGEEHWLSYLTQCDWCAGTWVAGALTTGLALYIACVMHQSWWPWPIWVLLGCTASTVTGLIASKEPE